MVSKKTLCGIIVGVLAVIVIGALIGVWQSPCVDGLQRVNLLCENINECDEGADDCQHMCNDTIPMYNCSCHDGYTTTDGGRSCIDIDECQENTHKCDQHCNNTVPEYTCFCDAGYKLDGDGFSCQPICSGAQACGDRGDCESPGACRCKSGYTGSNTGCSNITCEENPCKENSHCSGPNRCSCDDGFRLTSDRCGNINECDEGTDDCQHMCNDTIPMYNCSCHDGYTTTDGGRSCIGKQTQTRDVIIFGLAGSLFGIVVVAAILYEMCKKRNKYLVDDKTSKNNLEDKSFIVQFKSV